MRSKTEYKLLVCHTKDLFTQSGWAFQQLCMFGESGYEEYMRASFEDETRIIFKRQVAVVDPPQFDPELEQKIRDSLAK